MKHFGDKKAIKLFGNKLREIRLSKKLSQMKLANKAGIEFSQVGRIERGVINTSISTVYALAEGLEVSPHEFFLPLKAQKEVE
ncbi:MAG: helix-turn-helix transcriptional regulator [Bacteroidetes bacterium]|nr:helix-turn-helix transcriptional regulator [Bacteroidota bacterium]